MIREEEWHCGRRPKHDDFDDLDPNDDRFTGFQESPSTDADEDEDEEVDFDKPDFKKGGMWSDYAEDLDFEE